MMSERILVVVDAPMNAKYLEFTLTRAGNFEMVKTKSVGQILQLAEAQEVDLILRDVSLGNSYYQQVAEKIFSGVIPRTIPPEQPSTYLTEINFTGVRELNIRDAFGDDRSSQSNRTLQ